MNDGLFVPMGADAFTQHGQLMLKSEKLEFERGAAAKTENEDRYNGKENRHHNRHGTASSRKSLASLGPVEILSKDSSRSRTPSADFGRATPSIRSNLSFRQGQQGNAR